MKLIGNIIWMIISVAATIILAITLIIPYIPPHSPLNIVSGMNLLFPYALLFTLLCAIVCLFRKQFYTSVWVIIILLCSIPNIYKNMGISPYPTKTDSQSIQVCSYNVHYFNFYETKDKNALAYLKHCGADILCLQEVLVMQQGGHTLSQLDKALEDYPLYERIVILKIDGLQNVDIQKTLENEFGVKYSVEYISSLWRNKIPKLIASVAEDQYLYWYYLNEEKGHYKKCSRCG